MISAGQLVKKFYALNKPLLFLYFKWIEPALALGGLRGVRGSPGTEKEQYLPNFRNRRLIYFQVNL